MSTETKKVPGSHIAIIIVVSVLIVGVLGYILYTQFGSPEAQAKTNAKPGSNGVNPMAYAGNTSNNLGAGSIQSPNSPANVADLVNNATANMNDVTSNGGTKADGYRTFISSFYVGSGWSPYMGGVSDADATTLYTYLYQRWVQNVKPANSLFMACSAIVKKYGLPPAGTDWA